MSLIRNFVRLLFLPVYTNAFLSTLPVKTLSLFVMHNVRHEVPQSFTTDKCNMFFDSEREGEKFWTELSVAFIGSNALDNSYACSADLLVLSPYIFTFRTSYIMPTRRASVILQE